MADFEKAFNRTMVYETGNSCGYCADTDDPGGETFYGISRRNEPAWEGWIIIDEYKMNFPDDFAIRLKAAAELIRKVKDLYFRNYWRKTGCDKIADDDLACEIFDTAVNMGTKTAIKFLQTALNVLNRQGTLYPDIEEDGIFGGDTISSLEKYYEDSGAAPLLIKIINVLQGARYIDIMRSNKKLEKFVRGWFERVVL